MTYQLTTLENNKSSVNKNPDFGMFVTKETKPTWQPELWNITKTNWAVLKNPVGIYSNHMVFRQNLSPLFREPSLFFRGDEFYKNLFRKLSRRTVPFEEEIFYNLKKKEFAYRMRARRPTSAMPKPFLCCERAFCCSMVVMWPVLMSWSCLRREMK